MLADIFVIFAVLFFIIRLIFLDFEAHRIWMVVDILSALFMVLALFFIVFPQIAIQTVSANVYNVPISGSNIIQTLNSTITTTSPGISVSSMGFILLVAFVSTWVLICFVLMLYDFIRTRKQG